MKGDSLNGSNSLKRHNYLSRLALTIELLLVVGFITRPVAAHTEHATMRLNNASAGPYTITVWTYPTTLRAGSIHFTVAVVDTADGKPVDNAQVLVQASPLDREGLPVAGVATVGYSPATRYLYEADLTVREKGAYQVAVQVNDPTGASGETTFAIDVVSATTYQVFITILLVQALAVGVWLIKEGITTWKKPMPDLKKPIRRYSSS